jgi:hypothetical protein
MGFLYDQRMITRRYEVTETPTGHGIRDNRLGALCSLADKPLEWPQRRQADMWLYLCRVAWGHGLVAAPEGWNG